MAPRPFSLVKWYLDVVTQEGDTAILYCAALRWRGLRTAMASLLTAESGRVLTQTSLSRFRLDADEKQIAVECRALKAVGRWIADAKSVERCIYASAAGSVVWNCLQPRSRVAARIDGREMTGLGYAECLTLTLPPWKLPMQELRWGRFVSERDSLAWIDWQGEHAARLCILNEYECELRSVRESELAMDGAALHMERSVTLREGRLGDTILPGAPALARLFPRSLFSVAEGKWLSHGRLERVGGGSTGYAIHEVVHWKP